MSNRSPLHLPCRLPSLTNMIELPEPHQDYHAVLASLKEQRYGRMKELSNKKRFRPFHSLNGVMKASDDTTSSDHTATSFDEQVGHSQDGGDLAVVATRCHDGIQFGEKNGKGSESSNINTRSLQQYANLSRIQPAVLYPAPPHRLVLKPYVCQMKPKRHIKGM